jgi:hypothetical protein
MFQNGPFGPETMFLPITMKSPKLWGAEFGASSGPPRGV